jgi:hypothetical protein
MALVRKRTIPTERPALIGKVSANSKGCRMVSTIDPHEQWRAGGLASQGHKWEEDIRPSLGYVNRKEERLY